MCNPFTVVCTSHVPDLSVSYAQVALVALATNPSFHKYLLSTVKSWPPVIYSALPVISAIEPQLNSSSMTDALKEVSLNPVYILTYVLCCDVNPSNCNCF